jgi:transposase
MTIGIDLGDVWSHYSTLNEDGEVVDRGRFRTTPSGAEKWFTDLPRARIAMETGTHSIWISEQLRELDHEVIVANVRELRAISHSDRKSDQVDAEKIARYARLDPKILRPIAHRTVAQQEALTLIRARNLIVRLRTADWRYSLRHHADFIKASLLEAEALIQNRLHWDRFEGRRSLGKVSVPNPIQFDN